ncbi:MAG: TRAP transporter substrate-binding protein DctP [Clostridiales Family XIII bacterium]|nr:TRAP transporter substrate-binding protein DctP [Clostridiales Family XIII bacterium]
MKKKGIRIAMIAVLCVAMIGAMAACGSDSSSSTAGSGSTAAAGSTGGGEEPADDVTLKFTYWVGAGGLPEVKVVDPFVAAVEELTGGEVKIDKYPGGTLAASDATLEAVTSGLADIGFVYTGWETGSFPISSMLEYPTYFASNNAASYTYRDVVNLLKPAEFDGIHVLIAYGSGEGVFLSNVREITKPDDFKGQEVRVGSDVMNRTVTAFGGTPVSMPASESYEALRSGVCNAWQGTPEAVNNLKLTEVVDFATPIHFANTTYIVFMNNDVYNKLSAKNQAALDEAGNRTFEGGASNFMEDAATLTYENLEKEGAKVTFLTEAQEQAFIDVVGTYLDDFAKELDAKGLPGTESLATIREYQDKYNAQFPGK